MSDSLVATRARRANAGSRLKQLIELEELATPTQRLPFISEDDENVNLLFQEDENDGEFEVSDEDDEEEEGDEEGEEEEEGDGNKDDEDSEDNDGDTTSTKRKHQETADDDLSDSELSVTDSDESEGERELNKQEADKRKKLRKKKSLIPEIRRPKTSNTVNKQASEKPKSKKQRIEFTAESLLIAERSSSRASVKANKLELAERLRADEARRAALKPVAKIEYVEKTQEERLQEAIETEKANIIALQEFREQEIVKKEKQRLLLHLRRQKLLDVIRVESKAFFLGPKEEVEEARKLREQEMLKMKRRPGRKKKIEVEVPLTSIPGDIDTSLPYYKKQMAERKIQEEKEKQDAIIVDDKDSSKQSTPLIEVKKEKSDENEIIDDTESKEESVKEPDTNEQIKDEKEDASKDEAKNDDKEDVVEVRAEDDPSKTDDLKMDIDPKPEEEEKIDVDLESPLKDLDSVQRKVKFADHEDENSSFVKEESFVGESKEGTAEIKLESDESIIKKEEEIFEGPYQKICQNLVFLMDFESKMGQNELKTYLFGKQSLLPASHRFRDLKTIARIGEVNNPYVTVEEKKDELFEPASDLTEENAIFEELKRLPRFGDFTDIVEEEEADTEENSGTITITTEAPNSLYLPNGNKKYCLITGTEAKFFDPGNGMCYSSSEIIQAIRQIEQGKIPWYSFGGDINDFGRAELYIGNREGMRHAKGVPKGFDEFAKEEEVEEELKQDEKKENGNSVEKNGDVEKEDENKSTTENDEMQVDKNEEENEAQPEEVNSTNEANNEVRDVPGESDISTKTEDSAENKVDEIQETNSTSSAPEVKSEIEASKENEAIDNEGNDEGNSEVL